MKCLNCGVENKENNVYCYNCGSKLEDANSSSKNHDLDEEISCSNCGVLNKKDNTYCFKCGSPLFDESTFKRKNKILSAVVSLFIPGAGYFYLGYCLEGVIIFSIDAILTYLIINLHYYFLTWILLLFVLIQVIDSTRRIDKYNKHELVVKRKKSLWIAMFLSLYLRGLGLAYLGYYKRFAVIIIISMILLYSHKFLIYELYILEAIFALYVLYDTYVCFKAKERNEKTPLLFGLLDIK